MNVVLFFWTWLTFAGWAYWYWYMDMLLVYPVIFLDVLRVIYLLACFAWTYHTWGDQTPNQDANPFVNFYDDPPDGVQPDDFFNFRLV